MSFNINVVAWFLLCYTWPLFALTTIAFERLDEFYSKTMKSMTDDEKRDKMRIDEVTKDTCNEILRAPYFLGKKVDNLKIEFENYYVCRQSYIYLEYEHKYAYIKVRVVTAKGKLLSDYAATCLLCYVNTEKVMKLFVAPWYRGMGQRFFFAQSERNVDHVIPFAFIEERQLLNRRLDDGAFDRVFIDEKLGKANKPYEILNDSICRLKPHEKVCVCSTILSAVAAEDGLLVWGKYLVEYEECKTMTISVEPVFKDESKKLRKKGTGMSMVECRLKDKNSDVILTCNISRSGKYPSFVSIYKKDDDKENIVYTYSSEVFTPILGVDSDF